MIDLTAYCYIRKAFQSCHSKPQSHNVNPSSTSAMSSTKRTAPDSQTPASISSKRLKKSKIFRTAKDPTQGTSVHATTLRPQPTGRLRESKVHVIRDEDIPEDSQVTAQTEEWPPVSIDDLPELSTATMPQKNVSKQKKNTTSVSYLFILSSPINHSYGLNSLS